MCIMHNVYQMKITIHNIYIIMAVIYIYFQAELLKTLAISTYTADYHVSQI